MIIFGISKNIKENVLEPTFKKRMIEKLQDVVKDVNPSIQPAQKISSRKKKIENKSIVETLSKIVQSKVSIKGSIRKRRYSAVKEIHAWQLAFRKNNESLKNCNVFLDNNYIYYQMIFKNEQNFN